MTKESVLNGVKSCVEQILVNEVGNEQSVYLYLEDGHWCAYERSAYYLASLNIPIQLKREVIRDGFDVILLKAKVAVEKLGLSAGDSYIKLKKIGDDNLQLGLSSNIYGFPEWKESQLNVLLA